MTKVIDLTKVNLSGKGFFWTMVAMTAVLVMVGIAQFGAVKAKDMLKSGTSAAAQTADEF